jgi:hypothetical protein
MKLAIVGSRNLRIDITRFVPSGVSMILSGGAIGVDSAAEDFARKHKIPIRIFKPEYKIFGKIAPILRNKQIVRASDRILAIWDGKSRGTAHVIEFAHFLGKPVTVFVVRDSVIEKRMTNELKCRDSGSFDFDGLRTRLHNL